MQHSAFSIASTVAGIILIAVLAVLAFLVAAHGRDGPQYEDVPPEIRQWFQTLMQPDNPTQSCCGFADAYYADSFAVEDGKMVATITDSREDAPLGRPHRAPGTRVVVPDHKFKSSGGNPTGHFVIFINLSGDVLCFVTGTLL